LNCDGRKEMDRRTHLKDGMLRLHTFQLLLRLLQVSTGFPRTLAIARKRTDQVGSHSGWLLLVVRHFELWVSRLLPSIFLNHTTLVDHRENVNSKGRTATAQNTQTQEEWRWMKKREGRREMMEDQIDHKS
jgi:hypothetical protein